jgi:transcriptional regulator with XRE-family HTH domain
MPSPNLPPEIAAWRAAFGAQIRAVREERGLSQEALAEQAGVDRKLVYRTELGQTSPRMDTVLQLARVLQVTMPVLMPDLPISAKAVIDNRS